MAAVLSGVGGRSSAGDDSFNAMADRNSGASQSDDSEDSDDSYASASSNAIELQRSYDGHFYADIEVNGQMLRMLVDTGASGIALTREDARRAGIGISIGMPEVVGQGASGDVRGEVVTIDRVSLGSTTVEDVPAVVLDGGQQSLLGQSFLSQFDSVEIKGDRMLLR
jgi:aspartyl protease family protein